MSVSCCPRCGAANEPKSECCAACGLTLHAPLNVPDVPCNTIGSLANAGTKQNPWQWFASLPNNAKMLAAAIAVIALLVVDVALMIRNNARAAREAAPPPTTAQVQPASPQSAWGAIPSMVDGWIAKCYNPGTRPAIREGMDEDIKYGHYDTAREKALVILRTIRDRISKQLNTLMYETRLGDFNQPPGSPAPNGAEEHGPKSPVPNGPEEQTLKLDVLQVSKLIDDVQRLPVPE